MTREFFLGVVLVLILVIIAYYALRQKRRQDSFSHTAPATPLTRGIICELRQTLANIGMYGGLLGQDLGDEPGMKGMQQSAEHLTRHVKKFEQKLLSLPPTYANYLAIYHGLVDTASGMRSVLRTYASFGASLGPDPRFALITDHIAEFILQIGEISRITHNLGASLFVD